MVAETEALPEDRMVLLITVELVVDKEITIKVAREATT